MLPDRQRPIQQRACGCCSSRRRLICSRLTSVIEIQRQAGEESQLQSAVAWRSSPIGFTADNAKIENLQRHKTIPENQNSHIPHTYSQGSCTFAARNRDYPVVYAHEIHAYEVHVHGVHAREVHAYEGFCEDLARQNIVAHLSQLQLDSGVVTYGLRVVTCGLRVITYGLRAITYGSQSPL